jgi:hypothetical protein
LAAQQQAIQIQAQIQAMQLQNQMMLNGLGAGQTQAGGAPGQVGGGRVMGMGMNPATMTGNYGPAAAAAAAAGGFSSPCRLRIRLLEEMLNLSFLFAFSPCLSAAAANNQTGRTVYVGNLPPEASVDELLNLVRFGPIESVRLLPEKSCVFISFLDGSTAAAFHRQEARPARAGAQDWMGEAEQRACAGGDSDPAASGDEKRLSRRVGGRDDRTGLEG